ncbi:membrane protein [Arthrobacter phage Prairie]|uniref:Membrane protein n=1 Tax=Arthrobacter phage Prairie TaxID=2816463 RepID=A0A8A5LS69_9CAUD|nr:membrane protein [Arthrobacter phage Prairie]
MLEILADMAPTAAGALLGVLLGEAVLLGLRRYKMHRAIRRWSTLLERYKLDGKTGTFRIPEERPHGRRKASGGRLPESPEGGPWGRVS